MHRSHRIELTPVIVGKHSAVLRAKDIYNGAS